MLYVGIDDICRAYEAMALKILNDSSPLIENSLNHIVNVYYPKPITILQLAEIVKKAIVECSQGRIVPNIEIVDNGTPALFEEKDLARLEINIDKAHSYLGIKTLENPNELISKLVADKIDKKPSL